MTSPDGAADAVDLYEEIARDLHGRGHEVTTTEVALLSALALQLVAIHDRLRVLERRDPDEPRAPQHGDRRAVGWQRRHPLPGEVYCETCGRWFGVEDGRSLFDWAKDHNRPHDPMPLETRPNGY